MNELMLSALEKIASELSAMSKAEFDREIEAHSTGEFESITRELLQFSEFIADEATPTVLRESVAISNFRMDRFGTEDDFVFETFNEQSSYQMYAANDEQFLMAA